MRAAAAILLCVLTSACLAGAAIGAAGNVVEGAVKTTGAVVGAGVDAVTPGDDEEDQDED
ncbi:MAG: hypothetical protein GC189_10440 [Alphaproteobacteria bacterium]|nr:hypothetical protein [Alphaproteobacteria bacterium]